MPKIISNHIGFLLALVSVLIFSTTLPITRHALGEFSPWFITFTRALIPGLLAIPVIMLFSKNHFFYLTPKLIIAGLLLGYGFPGFSALAVQTVEANHAGVVLGIMPLLTALMATLIAGERPSLAFWFWSMIGAALVIIFVAGPNLRALSLGDFWLFCAALSATTGYVLSGQMTKYMPGWEVICRALIFCLPISALGTYLTWTKPFSSFSNLGTMELLYLGLFPMFIGFFSWNAALARDGMAKIGQTQLIQPFFTIGLSALVLGEHITGATLAFALAVSVTVLMARKARITRRG